MRRPRVLAAIGVAALVAAGLLSGRLAQTAPGQLKVAATSVVRPSAIPWFDMRLLQVRRDFTSSAMTAVPPSVSALGGILVDLDNGAILWQHDAHRRLPPASTEKIMTALVALDNFGPERPITVTASALQQRADETRMGLAAGQVLTTAELLSGMLLVSGNDAATVLAVDTVGSARFMAAMNAQAGALGMRDSRFTDPVGLAPGQYSSAYDLALVSAATVNRWPLFTGIVASPHITLPATAGHPRFDLDTINLLLSTYPAAVGIKPGWTGSAGYCLVGMAVRDGHHLLSVLLNAPYVVRQSRRLLDWGFVLEGLPSTLPSPPPSPSPHA